MGVDRNSVVMTHEDFGVCLATLVQTESYWEFQLKRCDGEMPGGFTREEVNQILGSIREVKTKIETILRLAGADENDDSDVAN